MTEQQPPEPIPDADLDAMETRANAATPGEWVWHKDGRPELRNVSYYVTSGDKLVCQPNGVDTNREANAVFIACAHADVPRLLREVRRLRAENADLTRDLAVLEAQYERLEAETRKYHGMHLRAVEEGGALRAENVALRQQIADHCAKVNTMPPIPQSLTLQIRMSHHIDAVRVIFHHTPGVGNNAADEFESELRRIVSEAEERAATAMRQRCAEVARENIVLGGIVIADAIEQLPPS